MNLAYKLKMTLRPRHAYNNTARRTNQALETTRDIVIERVDTIVKPPEEVFNDITLKSHIPSGPPIPNQPLDPAHFSADVHFQRANWFLGEKVRAKIAVDNS